MTDHTTPDTDGTAYVSPGADPIADQMRAALDAHLAAQAPPTHTPAHLAAQATSYAEAHAFGNAQIPEGRHMAPIAALPPSEFLMSLNGFDEIAIAARFGATLQTLRDDPVAAGRALAFTHYRRTGQNDHEAHQSALTLTLREVTEFFPPEPKDDASAEGNDDGAR